ncbi:hypothetical protein Tco_0921942 [Tanacetum coccineum]|uniref:Uncharacterized protein n=1 Tax=Tanacetum coccineum TaxID=301880 RepID=A0ABQ5CXT5_9ASTR
MFSSIYEPVHGIIYKNSKKEKRVMRHSEIHKFCDATLNRVLEGLKSYNNDVKRPNSTARLMKAEARMYRGAWGRSMDASDLARAEVMSLRTQVVAQQAVITELQAADCERQAAIIEMLVVDCIHMNIYFFTIFILEQRLLSFHWCACSLDFCKPKFL